MERALDELDVLGVALGTTLAVSWQADEREDIIRRLNNIAFALLQAGRWRAAQRMSEVGVALGSGNAWLDVAMQVNVWIARKQQDGLDAIRVEVEGWDVRALAPEFALAKAALVDDRDEAFRHCRGFA